MTNSLLTILIIDYPAGNRDCEIIEGEFTEEVRDSLDALFTAGTISNWEMREGYVNGGDSRVEWGTTG